MDSEEQIASLVVELTRLQKEGSRDDVINNCRGFFTLEPVVVAERNGVLRVSAARTLLELVVANDQAHTDMRMGAALAGIVPRNEARGVRGDSKIRRYENAHNISGEAARTIREHCPRYLRAYARAAVRYVHILNHDTNELAGYLHAAGVDHVAVERVVDSKKAAIEAASTVAGSRPQALQSELRSINIRLSSPILEALNSAREHCKMSNRMLHTPHILLALFGMPKSKVALCFEAVQPGLAHRLQAGLRSYVISSIHDDQGEDFEPFDLLDRPEIIEARRLASMHDASSVNELHLLLALLCVESNTRSQLAELLGSDFLRLVQVVEEALQVDQRRATPGAIFGAFKG